MKYSLSHRSFRSQIYYCAIFTAITGSALLVSCVKDTLYVTTHPGHGVITLTAEWDDIDSPMEIPDEYTVNIGDHTERLKGNTNEIKHLFIPGRYTVVTYNTPEGITVTGTTAVIDGIARNGNVNMIYDMPGWLYTDVRHVEIAADRDYNLVASMKQQTGMLNLVITPTGNLSDRIESIEGYLHNIAGTYDFADGVYGSPSSVRLRFRRIAGGKDAGKWIVAVRMLGVAGNRQQLEATINFTGGNPAQASLSSDLSSALSGFNDTKTIPLTLNAFISESPATGEFSAILSGWNEVTNGEIEIH